MDELYREALARFDEVFGRARDAGIEDANAMVLATVGADGQPASRVVLLKGHDARGFVFYTNLESRKGTELQADPRAALCFFWREIHEQVRIEGAATAVSEEEADAYFASRDRLSQIGAWASRQSEPLANRDLLERRMGELERRFADGAVPRPPYWSGLRVLPARIEFWRGMQGRLHERTLYWRENGRWQVGLLNP